MEYLALLQSENFVRAQKNVDECQKIKRQEADGAKRRNDEYRDRIKKLEVDFKKNKDFILKKDEEMSEKERLERKKQSEIKHYSVDPVDKNVHLDKLERLRKV